MIRISEIFGPTLQGEGALIGQPTVFVRTGGCDYRCSWCDTLHAVDSQYRHEWIPMSAEEIFAKVEKLSGGNPLMVSLSGGNPAIHNLKPLIGLGKAKDYKFALETQGSVAQDWFVDLDVLTLSPKPPSSGMVTDWNKFEECLKAVNYSPSPLRERDQGRGVCIVLKLVVFDEADYQYARATAEKYPHLPVYLQPGNHTPPPAEPDAEGIANRLRWLAERVIEDRWFAATVLPQLHVMLWGNARGV